MIATILPIQVGPLTTYGIGIVTSNGTKLVARVSYPSNGAAVNAAISLMQAPFQEELWDLVNDITIVSPKGS